MKEGGLPGLKIETWGTHFANLPGQRDGEGLPTGAGREMDAKGRGMGLIITPIDQRSAICVETCSGSFDHEWELRLRPGETLEYDADLSGSISVSSVEHANALRSIARSRAQEDWVDFNCRVAESESVSGRHALGVARRDAPEGVTQAYRSARLLHKSHLGSACRTRKDQIDSCVSYCDVLDFSMIPARRQPGKVHDDRF